MIRWYPPFEKPACGYANHDFDNPIINRTMDHHVKIVISRNCFSNVMKACFTFISPTGCGSIAPMVNIPQTTNPLFVGMCIYPSVGLSVLTHSHLSCQVSGTKFDDGPTGADPSKHVVTCHLTGLALPCGRRRNGFYISSINQLLNINCSWEINIG